MRILFPVDGSLCSLDAADEVARRPWPCGNVVRRLFVASRASTEAPSSRSLAWNTCSQLRDTAHYAFEKAAARLATGDGASLGLECALRHGDPRQMILAEARAWGADLIVMTAHRAG